MTLFRNLGPFRTTAIGHGEMPLTIENNRGQDIGIETLHASLDAGCRHIDTAWAYYTPGEEEQTGEKLVREALETWHGPRDEVTVATKVGLRRAWEGDKPVWPRDGKPEHLIAYGKQSAQALGVDSIDLLYLHRHDPEVPYNESCEGIIPTSYNIHIPDIHNYSDTCPLLKLFLIMTGYTAQLAIDTVDTAISYVNSVRSKIDRKSVV